jgi:mRNA interferase MazF
MPRGDVIVAAGSGSTSKPRPCIVLQADEFGETDSVTICPLSAQGEAVQAPDLRVPIAPAGTNGLKAPSWAMVDKIMTLRRANVAQTIGRLTDGEMAQISRAAIVFLKLA